MYNPAASFSSEVLLYCNFSDLVFFSILLKMQHFSMMDLITGLFHGNVIVPEGDAMC